MNRTSRFLRDQRRKEEAQARIKLALSRQFWAEVAKMGFIERVIVAWKVLTFKIKKPLDKVARPG